MLRSNLLNASQRIANEMPDVIILEMDAANKQDFELAERFKTQYKNMTLMMMSTDTSSELLLKAMRSGFSEVIPNPPSEEQLTKALDRYQSKRMSNATSDSKVLSFISCKGGSGNTFIATNLGYILAAAFNKKVLLIDANAYFGDALMYVSDKKPSMTLADISNQMDRLDFSFLESSLISVIPNFKILAAADDPANAAEILPEHLEKVIRIARNYYDYIILDVSRHIDGLTVKALDLSDTIYPVLQLVLPYVRDAKHILALFKSLGYAKAKVKPIINRYDKAGKLKIADLSHVIDTESMIVLPNDYDAVTDSLNQGDGVYKLYKSKPITKSLTKLAESITGAKVMEKSIISKFFSS
ncbi:MAG TPA: AAA family ATPase [Methylophilaceae bacterium]|nr:AAA family ATPase [Methylophilaceae bacterium]